MLLEERLHRVLPKDRVLKIQLALGIVGFIGMFVAPFLSTGLGVKVINEVSMITLVVAALAGISSERNP